MKIKTKNYVNVTVRVPFDCGVDTAQLVKSIGARLGDGWYASTFKKNYADNSYDIDFVHAEGIPDEVELI